MLKNQHINIHTDGGSRGNPGPSAIGFVIDNNENTLFSYGKPIGIGTNNQAEYEAVIESLRWVAKNIDRKGESIHISFFLDSLLVVQQLRGLFKIKHPDLRARAFAIHSLIQELEGHVTFTHIPRNLNADADHLVNQALDTGKEISF